MRRVNVPTDVPLGSSETEFPLSGQRFYDLFWPSFEKKCKTTETSTDVRIILENMLYFLH